MWPIVFPECAFVFPKLLFCSTLIFFSFVFYTPTCATRNTCPVCTSSPLGLALLQGLGKANSCLNIYEEVTTDLSVENVFFPGRDTGTLAHTERQRETETEIERTSIFWLNIKDSCRFLIIAEAAWGHQTLVIVPVQL